MAEALALCEESLSQLRKALYGGQGSMAELQDAAKRITDVGGSSFGGTLLNPASCLSGNCQQPALPVWLLMNAGRGDGMSRVCQHTLTQLLLAVADSRHMPSHPLQ
jgi:hypothetical protein